MGHTNASVYGNREKETKLIIVKGLLNIPKRYFINLHDVVARDRFTANMHVAVAGGFICSVLLIYLVYLFNIKYFLLLHALTLCLLLMIAGSVAVMYRRHFRSQARTAAIIRWAMARIPICIISVCHVTANFCIAKQLVNLCYLLQPRLLFYL